MGRYGRALAREGAVAAALSVALGCGASSSSSSAQRGAVGGSCYGNGTCNAGLTCLSNLCVSTQGGNGSSSGGTSSSGGSGSPGPVCAASGQGCSCSVGSQGNGALCSSSAYPGTTCCASATWPSSGTCSCQPTPQPVSTAVCGTDVNGYCACAASLADAPAGFTANASPSCNPSDCVGGGGCELGNICGCIAGRTSCGSWHPVTSCGVSSFPPPQPQACATGTTEVSSCEPSATAGSSGSSSGGSTGGTCGTGAFASDFAGTGGSTQAQCLSCIESHCCSEAQACSADSACPGYLYCVVECYHCGCLSTCTEPATATSLRSCVSSSCPSCGQVVRSASTCGSSSGASSSSGGNCTQAGGVCYGSYDCCSGNCNGLTSTSPGNCG